MRIRVRLATLALLTSVAACAPAAPKPDTAKDEAAIRQLVTDWNGYLTAQNDSAITALYTDDAVLLPPGQPRVSGHAAIRQFWAGLWALKATLALASVGVRVAGDLAVEEGNWDFTAGEMKDHGKYVVIWARTGGSWKAIQDIWNSDQPPPAQPAAAAPAQGR